jgi:hypothetical protein
MTSKVSRRAIFEDAGGLAACAPAARPAVAAPLPADGNDAILTRLADEAELIKAALQGLQDGPANDDAEEMTLLAREDDIVDRVAEIVPETIAGLRAIARVMRLDFERNNDNNPIYDSTATRLAITIADHLLGPENGKRAVSWLDVGISDTKVSSRPERIEDVLSAFGNDITLAALADQTERLTASLLSLPDGPLLYDAEENPAANAEADGIRDHLRALRHKSAALQATCKYGWRAKARLALLHADLSHTESGWFKPDRDIAGSLVTDLLSDDEIRHIRRIKSAGDARAIAATDPAGHDAAAAVPRAPA